MQVYSLGAYVRDCRVRTQRRGTCRDASLCLPVPAGRPSTGRRSLTPKHTTAVLIPFMMGVGGWGGVFMVEHLKRIFIFEICCYK